MAATPAPKSQSKTLLILGCVALIFLAIAGFCVLSLGGLVFLGGHETRTPTLAAQGGAATPSNKTSATSTASVSLSNLSPSLRTALLGSVYVESPDDTGRTLSSGSGTILTPQGHILTNFHVISDNDTGKLDNKQGLAYIGVTSPDLNAKPSILYLAQFIKGDKELDLALLRIVAMRDGGKLPTDLKLTPVPIGDSDKVQIGDEVTVIGFPGLGEGTVTLTKGAVAGFVDDSTSVGTWIKTDAEINSGNSGGMAINKAGEVIGVPTATLSDKKDIGKIGYVRPISFAKPLTQFALRDAQSPVTFVFAGWSSSPTRVPTTTAGASFAQIVICDDVKDGKPVNPRTTFPAGTKKVTAYWTYKGVNKGQEWGRRWLQDGQVITDKPGQQWDGDASGSYSVSFTSDQGLDAGTYELQLFIGKTLAQKATFTVAKTSGTTPTAVPQTAGSFGKIQFTLNADAEIQVAQDDFPAGTAQVWAMFTYVNMKSGDAWGRKWLRDGTVQLERNETWNMGATGRTSYAYFNTDGSPLTPGNYEFVLYLGGREVQRAAFVVASSLSERNDCGDIPTGLGGLAIVNYYGREINYTIDGDLYAIPAKGDVAMIYTIYLSPGTHIYSANIPGMGSKNGTIEIREGQCFTQSWAAQ
ncbi:MAG: trypsin-like peptidase domain-containing protein [Chloroflexota bacterium]|nr:trypsin-like peptidase domain-containing protein [Chloroflexota bacterium]